MGVMACARRGCSHVLCDRLLAEDLGYICQWCFEELTAFRATLDLTGSTAPEIKAKVEAFMATEPGTYRKLSSQAADAEFDRLMGRRE